MTETVQSDPASRVSTENFLDEDDETSAEQLNRWIENVLVCLTFLVILSLYEYVKFSPFFLIVPLVLSATKTVLVAVVRRKFTCVLLGKHVFVFELIAAFANLTFYISIPALYGVVASPILVIPLGIEAVAKVAMRCLITSECYLFSELVITTYSITKLITLLSLGFKLDGYAGFTWTSVFWPCWMLISFLSVVTLGLFLLMVGSFCTWAVNEAESIEILASSWMFFSSFGVTFSLVLFLVTIGNYMENGESLSPNIYYIQAYLLVFLLFTITKKPELIMWWTKFFIEEQPEVPNTPEPPRTHIVKLLFKIAKAPSKLLVRMSSTYYLPTSPKNVRRNSDLSMYKDNKSNHFRFRSLNVAEDASTQRHVVESTAKHIEEATADRKVCVICYDKNSNSVILPCGHAGLCYTCAMEGWKKSDNCHFCRTKVEKVLLIPEEPAAVVRALHATEKDSSKLRV